MEEGIRRGSCNLSEALPLPNTRHPTTPMSSSGRQGNRLSARSRGTTPISENPLFFWTLWRKKNFSSCMVYCQTPVWEGWGFSLYSSVSPDGAVVTVAVWRTKKLEELAEEEEEEDGRSRNRADAERTSSRLAAAACVGVPALDGTSARRLPDSEPFETPAMTFGSRHSSPDRPRTGEDRHRELP